LAVAKPIPLVPPVTSAVDVPSVIDNLQDGCPKRSMYTQVPGFHPDSPYLLYLNCIDLEKRSAHRIATLSEFLNVGGNRRDVEFTSISECFLKDSSRRRTRRQLSARLTGDALDKVRILAHQVKWKLRRVFIRLDLRKLP